MSLYLDWEDEDEEDEDEDMAAEEAEAKQVKKKTMEEAKEGPKREHINVVFIGHVGKYGYSTCHQFMYSAIRRVFDVYVGCHGFNLS